MIKCLIDSEWVYYDEVYAHLLSQKETFIKWDDRFECHYINISKTRYSLYYSYGSDIHLEDEFNMRSHPTASDSIHSRKNTNRGFLYANADRVVELYEPFIRKMISRFSESDNKFRFNLKDTVSDISLFSDFIAELIVYRGKRTSLNTTDKAVRTRVKWIMDKMGVENKRIYFLKGWVFYADSDEMEDSLKEIIYAQQGSTLHKQYFRN